MSDRMTCGECEGEGSACAVDYAKGLIPPCPQCHGSGVVSVCKPFRQDLLLVGTLERLLSFAKRAQFDDEDGVRAYTITLPSDEADKRGVREDYLTRFLTPKCGPMRLMLHHIHRPDSDRYLHNHPWKSATSVILNGGYDEERRVETPTTFLRDEKRGDFSVSTIYVQNRLYAPGDINHLTNNHYHRITAVKEETWTLFINDTRLPEGWGYLIDGKHVPQVSQNTDKEES